ncbi:MAG: mechanosensitive ion channel domain-containing protein [Desulfobacterales bacterium]
MAVVESIRHWLSMLQIDIETGDLLVKIIAGATVLLISLIAFYMSRRLARGTIPRFIARTRNTWDDLLVAHDVFKHLALLPPALILFHFLPLVLDGNSRVEAIFRGVLNLYFIVATLLVLDALINALHAIYRRLPVAREIPLTGFFQVLKIILYFVSIILVLAVIVNKTPVYLFSGLGAMTAVLLLIFKDPILGFVAGVQLISNRMLKHGDWIEMPKYGADGDVQDITLTTVKVRNWDETITTIPTYALITDSFKNWRGMQESGGRRIKRAITIDVNSIRFCTNEMLERFAKIRYIVEYMQAKNREVNAYNARLGDDERHAVNCRRLTNIGTFRAYVIAYLRNHPMINQQMTFLVRQLAPTDRGLPLEIYVFCREKGWAAYEAIQSDIFDHLLAIASEFDLRVFQYPSGRDLGLVLARMSLGESA